MLGKKRNSNAFVLFVALVVIAAVLLVRGYASAKTIFDFTQDTTEMDNINLRYEPGPVLYLSNGCQGIRMGITSDQAFSIREVLANDMFSRPLTHDLVFETFSAFNIKLVYAKIDAIKDGIYTAKLLFSDNTLYYEADSRPSDMAAFTLRYRNKFAISNSLASNMTNVC
ncbi:MAG: bifunctional nuclease domain-containing protein [Candidatus Aenigmatarchaeota archaeon]